MVPRFTWKPVENVTAAGLPMKWASFSSSSSWIFRVPLRNRLPPQPVP
jgi:hypothetical protein